jgi:drug/metabolite transporter (DMT)-like permease
MGLRQKGVVTGIAFMVAGAAVFATMDALVKWLVATYPVIQVTAFRSAFALVVVVPALLAGGLGQLRTRRPWAHLLRSIIGLIAIACFFQALDQLPLAQVTGIFFAAPLAMTALSVPLLKERVGPRRWAAVAVVAPFDYLHLVFASAYGWALWRDRPTASTLAGSAVIMACGLYVLHREAKGKSD